MEHIVPGDAVVMLDLDHFKRVNDDLGHARGDEVLAELGRYLQRAIRTSDSVARYGGEEFVVVLSAPGAGLRSTIERLLDGWRATHPVTTVSIGAAAHLASRTTAETMSAADGALYIAKRSGRDCARIAGDPEPRRELLNALPAPCHVAITGPAAKGGSVVTLPLGTRRAASTSAVRPVTLRVA